MRYATIDPVIADWAKQNTLHVATCYKDVEVRSVDVVNRKGERCQIWVDAPDTDKVRVHVWDYHKRRSEYASDVDDLRSSLDRAYTQAYAWLMEPDP